MTLAAVAQFSRKRLQTIAGNFEFELLLHAGKFVAIKWKYFPIFFLLNARSLN
jgi:hypothetical protein